MRAEIEDFLADASSLRRRRARARRRRRAARRAGRAARATSAATAKARVERVMELRGRRPGDRGAAREGERPRTQGLRQERIRRRRRRSEPVPPDDRRDRPRRRRLRRPDRRGERVAQPADHERSERTMLAPRDTPTRERKSLNGLWRFALDAAGGAGRRAGGSGRSPGAREIPVPASYNDLFPDAAVHDHVGDAWYQTLVRVPSGWAGERIVLRFDAATHRAVVWVDEHAGRRARGRLHAVRGRRHRRSSSPGGENRITVVVDNILSWQSIPPGYVEETPGRPPPALLPRLLQLRRPPPHGLALHRRPPRTSAMSPSSPAWTARPGPSTTRSRRPARRRPRGRASSLRDAAGAEVARATGASGELDVDGRPSLAPGRGLPLRARPSSWRGRRDGRRRLPADRSGSAPCEVDGARFLINGEPFYFRGFGKHEDSAVRGKGHDDAFMVHDFALMEWLGANSFRTSHYPYAEEVLEYADRHGIVVIDETAAVGINARCRRRASAASRSRPSPTRRSTTATQEVHRQAIRELIARDKNHPCVVIWSIANEPESWTPESRALLRAARRRDAPARPDAPGRLRQLHGRDARPRRDHRPLRRRSCSTATTAGTRRPGDLAAAERSARGGAARAGPTSTTSRSSSPSTAPTPSPACTSITPDPGPRSTRPTCSTCSTASSTGSTRSSASRSGTSPTSRPRPGSCASTATRRASSPASAGRRRPRTCCAGAGAAP